ncbi:NAD(P)H-binding protein [Methylophilus sp. Leaf414]|uniref:NAD(P)H-binding protein n=1 Tax=Methylophilus sp. Leaf414 TaxID=1736371 RepID=UPI0006F6A336|nr:NAD(P)H-binding protein [Methylophilus sp. Leaf414]KQT36729.1 hypothetical protein ASG24_06205 [Methylophilus sp. Leaf414]
MTHSPLLISGASGRLGQAVVQTLLKQKIHQQRPLILTTRTPEKLAMYQQPGVEIRQANFDEPAELASAFRSAKRMLLISTNLLDGTGKRVEQHRHAIDAARHAGTEQVVYTSFIQPLHGLPMPPARDHLATEALIQQSTMRYTILRNAFYYDMLMPQIREAIETGTVSSVSGNAAIAYIAREDCAKAAAQALITESKDMTFTLTGQTLNLRTFASRLGSLLNKPVTYQAINGEQKLEQYGKAGLPHAVAKLLVEIDQALLQGAMDIQTADFKRLTGLEPASPEDFIRQQLALDEWQ